MVYAGEFRSGTYQALILTHGEAGSDVEAKESQHGSVSRVTLMRPANIIPVDMISILSNWVVEIKTLVRGRRLCRI